MICSSPNMKKKLLKPHQPTGQKCSCRKGTERDNCPQCEGTGLRINFRAVFSSFLSELDDYEWNQ
jgi:hypothetical protein